MKRLSIIIPCFNEEEVLPHLLKRMASVVDSLKNEWSVELLFVDDGSSDNTPAILDDFAKKNKFVKVLHHKKNMNLGAALRTGIKEASGDVIVTNDSDCTYPPEEIPLLLSHLVEGVDMVTASPYHPKGGVENVPAYRLFLSKSVSGLYKAVTKSNIHTFTSLFRAYRAPLAKSINFRYNDFLGVTELLIYPLLSGKVVREYPTVLRVRKYGSSKIKILKIIRNHLKFLWYIMRNKKKLSRGVHA